MFTPPEMDIIDKVLIYNSVCELYGTSYKQIIFTKKKDRLKNYTDYTRPFTSRLVEYYVLNNVSIMSISGYIGRVDHIRR